MLHADALLQPHLGGSDRFPLQPFEHASAPMVALDSRGKHAVNLPTEVKGASSAMATVVESQVGRWKGAF